MLPGDPKATPFGSRIIVSDRLRIQYRLSDVMPVCLPWQTTSENSESKQSAPFRRRGVKNFWDSLREVLMPSPVGFVCAVLKKQKSFQTAFEGRDCFSSSLRNATAGEEVAP